MPFFVNRRYSNSPIVFANKILVTEQLDKAMQAEAIAHTIVFIINVFVLLGSFGVAIWYRNNRMIMARSKSIEFIYWLLTMLLCADYYVLALSEGSDRNVDINCSLEIWFNYTVRPFVTTNYKI